MKLVNGIIKKKLQKFHQAGESSDQSRNNPQIGQKKGLKYHTSNNGWVFNKHKFKEVQEKFDFYTYKKDKRITKPSEFEIPLLPCLPEKAPKGKKKPRSKSRLSINYNLKKRFASERRPKRANKSQTRLPVPSESILKSFDLRKGSRTRRRLRSRQFSSVSMPKGKSVHRDRAKVICNNNNMVRKISSISSLGKDTLLRASKESMIGQIRKQYYG